MSYRANRDKSSDENYTGHPYRADSNHTTTQTVKIIQITKVKKVKLGYIIVRSKASLKA